MEGPGADCFDAAIHVLAGDMVCKCFINLQSNGVGETGFPCLRKCYEKTQCFKESTYSPRTFKFRERLDNRAMDGYKRPVGAGIVQLEIEDKETAKYSLDKCNDRSHECAIRI